jgi:hypothetical protein
MISFQIYGLTLVFALALITLLAIYRNGRWQLTTLLWLLMLLLAGGALLNPDATTMLAQTLGIKRGADLLIYCTALGSLTVFFLLYLKIQRMQREITQLVRELALHEADNSPIHHHS